MKLGHIAAVSILSVASGAAIYSLSGGASPPTLQAGSPDIAGASLTYFEPNVGQFSDPSIKFVARVGTGSVVLRNEGVSFADGQGVLTTMYVKGAEPQSPKAAEKLPGVVNYLLGPKDRWHTRVPTYAQVRYAEVLPGVDLLIYSRGPKVEYDLEVDAGVDARNIRLTFDGAQELAVGPTGELTVHTDRGSFVHQAPVVVHPDGTREAVSFATPASERMVAFALPNYDPREAVVIDPVIAYSSFLGGASGGGEANDIYINAGGDYAVVGSTDSTAFPVMSALEGTAQGGTDAFVTKFNSTNTVVFSTYLGGGSDEVAHAVAVAGDGTVWVGGETASADFPTTRCGVGTCPACNTQVAAAYNFCGVDDTVAADYCAGTIPAGCTGTNDGFLTILTSDGSALSYSTYLGGTADDYVYDIEIAGGFAHVVGETFSDTTTGRFPAVGGVDTTLDGANDGFYLRVDPATAYDPGLAYGTYVGGTSTDFLRGVAVDANGDVFMTGGTASSDFPDTDGTTLQGTDDAVLVDFDEDNGGIEFATFIGGTGFDAGYAVAVNGADDVFVGGEGSTASFLPTANALGTGGVTDGFIIRYDTATPGTTFSSLLGTTGTDSILAVAAGGSNQAIVAGTWDMAGSGYPFDDEITQNFGQGFVARMNATGTGTIFNTPVGGSNGTGGEAVNGVASDGTSVYVAGTTNNPPSFPLVGASFDSVNDTGNNEGFVMRIAEANADVEITISDSPDPVTLGNTLTYTVSVTNNGPTAVVDVPVDISTMNGGVTLMGWNATTAGGTCNVGAESAQCTIDNIANAATVDITVTMTPMNAAGMVTLGADLDDGGYGIYWTDTTPGNNSAMETTTAQAPVANADLSVAIADAPDPITLGSGNITYTIDVTNNGPDAAAGVQVSLALDANVTYDSDTGSCTGTGPVVCTIGALANSATSQFTVVVTPTNAGDVTSTASVTSSSNDGTPGNDSAMATTTVDPPAMGADVGVQISAAPMPAITGNILTYTVTVTNNGPEDATNVALSVDLDDASTEETATPSQGSCTLGDPTTCDLGTITASSMVTVTIEMTTAAAGSVDATASVTADQTDANAANDSAPISVTVEDPLLPQADLDVDIVEMTDPIILGDTANYTFTIENDGPEVATDVTFVGTVSGVIGTVTVTPATGSCVGTNSFTCSFGNFADAQSTTVDISVVTATAGLLTVTGTATSTMEEDPRPGRATAGENTTVLASVAPTITVSSGPGASPTSADGGDIDVPLLTARLAAGGLEDSNINQMTFTVTGTGDDPVDVASVKVYQDLNNNGRIELDPMVTMTPDLLLGTGTFDANDGTAVVNLTGGMPVVAQMSGTFILAADFAGEPPAMGGMTFWNNGPVAPWLAPLFAALALLLGGLAVATRRRVRVWAGTLALGMVLAAAGCSSGGGQQQQVVRGDRTFTVSLTDVQATGFTTMGPATVTGLPLRGRPVEVSFGDGI